MTTDRVTGFSNSVAFKPPCKVATTAAITLSGEQTIDGVAIVAGDRVLVKNQSTTSDNGIYTASTGAWSRAKDFDGERDVLNGTMVFVTSGTTNANEVFRLSCTDPVTIDTTSLSFTSVLSLTSASAFIQTLLDDTDAATARSTLGAASTAANTFTGKQIGKAFDVDAITDVASASTCDIGAAATGIVRITGTTTITNFGTANAGVYRRGYFSGILTLTHNATSLIIPGGANITTAANDRFEALSLGSGNWLLLDYQKADGQPVVTPTVSNSGKIVQIVRTESSAVQTGTTAMFLDDTIPQNTEGDQYLSVSITPTNASSTLLIEVLLHAANSGGTSQIAALFQDSNANAINSAVFGVTTSAAIYPLIINHKMTAGTTSATTFKVRSGTGSGTTTINGTGGARRMGGVLYSSITITEILP